MVSLSISESQLLALDDLLLKLKIGEKITEEDVQTAAQLHALTNDKIRRVMARLAYAEMLQKKKEERP